MKQPIKQQLQRAWKHCRFAAAIAATVLFVSTPGAVTAQTCGADIYIANDQSGSIDATENAQGRNFIRTLAQSLTLGNANNQSRIAIAEWAHYTTWAKFAFSSAGANYTTQLSDVIGYANAPRTLNGGTDPYEALRKTFLDVKQTPVAGRGVPRILLLMTDADCTQLPGGLSAAASQLKASGVYIMVLAIDNASTCTALQGTNIASPGMYFSASSYSQLAANANATVTNMMSSLCANTTTNWDLSIALTAANCTTGAVSYTVTNEGTAGFSGTVAVSLYDGDPTLTTTKLLASTTHPGVSLAAATSTTLSYTDALLAGYNKLYAVVNISTAGNNAVPALPYNITGRLSVTGEVDATNNMSAGFSPTGCPIPTARLEVSKTYGGMTCDKKVTYNVQVCNTGTADAANVMIRDIPASSSFQFLSGTGFNGASAPGIATAGYAHPGGDVAATGNDGYTLGTGSFFGTLAGVGNSNATNTYRISGFRFPPASAASAIPQGAKIVSATLALYCIGGQVISLPGTLVKGDLSTASPIFNASSGPNTRYAGGLLTTNSNTFTLTTSTTSSLDVKGIVQELVNQTGWNSSSALTFLVYNPDFTTLNTVTRIAGKEEANPPVLTITYESGSTIGILTQGKCATMSFIYDASTAAAGTYDNSASVSTTTTPVTYLPNTGFTTNGIAGLNGYNGAVNTADNVTIPASTGCATTPQPVTTAVSISPNSSCGGAGSYVTATITINNPNTLPAPGISIANAIQQLQASTGVTFASEPYNITNGLQLAQASTLDPAYPNVANALYGKSTANLSITSLPPGTSTFQVDIDAGTSSGTINLAATVINLPATYNASGSSNTASDANGVTITPAPTATFTCPASQTAATVSFAITGGATTGATAATWSSGTNGSFATGGTIAAPTATYTINNKDRANGYVDIQLYARNGTCDASKTCHVLITGTAYDFGDLPATYDFSQTGIPYVAAALNPSTTLKLGALNSDGETAPQSGATATGDNTNGTNDEDGVASFPTIVAHITSYAVTVNATNNTAIPARMIGWIDWNNDGQFQPTEASLPVTVPAGTSGNFVASWSGINTAQNMLGYARFRIAASLDSFSYIGSTDGGEVEDYRILATPLPLTLISFDATKRGNDGLLSWTTTNEQHVDYFSVEHSIDGKSFTEVGKVAAANIAGNHGYSFNHGRPGNGSHYYRLKMADINAAYTYSEVRVLNFGTMASSILLYPNPVQHTATVTGLEAGNTLRVLAMDGRIIGSQQATGNTATIDVSTLPSGIYLLQVVLEGGVMNTIRFTRN